ncbi:ABC transporter substrate-binding protein [Sporichthya sp.]|uniref:ABC transporter substrate-binding protein n=1 Tax=Sporichthya sp. TaxID=65475 RepID=UPI001834C74E|nr:ABC transporter substrate-binding protein [Sporichthya sp.]MBA3741705.1 ABC transporter substrate-binding protein [Sporichthya sp.]
MRRTRFGRGPSIAVAVMSALALVAGCGGSSVEDSAADSQPTVQDAVVPGVQAGADSVGAVDTTAGVPAAGSAADAAAPADSTAAAAGAAAGSSGNASKDKKAGGTAKTPGQAAGTGLAAERMAASAAIFGGNAPCKPATLSEVNIGNVSTLSGVLGELFSPAASALQVFVSSQNACGGLNGHKIKFFLDDDQGDPTTAASKVQEMISGKKILAFVGNIQVLTVDAIVPVIKRSGIPVIGSDMTSNTWFTNPLMFPQGSPLQSVGYGFNLATRDYFKKKVIGTIYCLEVPRACEQYNLATKELAPSMGVEFRKEIQASLTAPSYIQECLAHKNAGVEVLGLLIDAASQHRIARSCIQVDYYPNVVTTPISVGNDKQFLQGKPWLGNAYIAMNVFPWVGDTTPAQKYFQAMVKKYSPGMTSGGSASYGWTAGALLVAASAGFSQTNPTTQQLLDTLWTFKGQKFTSLGGLSGPRSFGKDTNPRVPYCLFGMITNDQNTGWKLVDDKATCTDQLSASDPQRKS